MCSSLPGKACLLLITFSLSACSVLPRNPVPIDKQTRAELPGYSGIRAWASQTSEAFTEDLVLSVRQEKNARHVSERINRRSASILAISGGGENGAFAAGLLSGWSKSGTRPQFKLVTGVSTGALIAPYALLGQKYDGRLREMYTSISPGDIYESQSIFSIISGESLTDTSPFKRFVKKYFNAELVADVAKAHMRGQRLYVGTTHLDADQLVIWNMGKIAASGNKNAVKLFQDILIASASIPGAFPPVYLKVRVDSKQYDEMHVDGGLKAQTFVSAAIVSVKQIRKRLGIDPHKLVPPDLYIIRNGMVRPEPQQVQRRLKSILARTVSTMTKTSGFGDLYRMYLLARQQGTRFHYISIPESYEWVSDEEFDPLEMKQLFVLGHDMARKGVKWHRYPPGLGPE